jgi:hypothetical protein
MAKKIPLMIKATPQKQKGVSAKAALLLHFLPKGAPCATSMILNPDPRNTIQSVDPKMIINNATANTKMFITKKITRISFLQIPSFCSLVEAIEEAGRGGEAAAKTGEDFTGAEMVAGSMGSTRERRYPARTESV